MAFNATETECQGGQTGTHSASWSLLRSSTKAASRAPARPEAELKSI